MTLTIGTFNLNNLFSRFNFQASVAQHPQISSGGLTLTFDEGDIDVRTFMGRLVIEKDEAETATIADRILQAVQADVLAVQEVEHIEILKKFNKDFLDNAYSEIVLIEGNDTRMIDVGLLSKRPIGAVTSFQAARHGDDPNRRIFGRDLLRVEILKDNGDKLLSIYNTHMKSHFVPFNQDQAAGKQAANLRRQRQAEVTRDIISRQERADGKFVLLGDMNDPPDSQFLEPMLTIDGRPMVNGLTNARETRPAKPETASQGPGPATTSWTHRFNPPGPEFPHYEQFDQIWLSDALAPSLQGAFIDRRTKHGGDGSDHDPAWVELDI